MTTLACGHEPTEGFAFYPSPSAPEVCRTCWLNGTTPPTLAKVVVVPGHVDTIEIDVRVRDDFDGLLEEAA